MTKRKLKKCWYCGVYEGTNQHPAGLCPKYYEERKELNEEEE